MFAFAQAGAAEVEAQDRPSKAMEDFCGMIDNFVVHGAAAERVRMADQRNELCVGMTFVEQRLKAAGGAMKLNRADRWCIRSGVRLIGSAENGLLLGSVRNCGHASRYFKPEKAFSRSPQARRDPVIAGFRPRQMGGVRGAGKDWDILASRCRRLTPSPPWRL